MAGEPVGGSPAARVVVPVRTVWFTPGAVLLVVSGVVVAFALRNLFVAAHQIVGWVVACSIVALLIDSLVVFVQQRLPRPLAVIAVVVGTIAAFTVLVVGVAREVLNSLDDLERAAPDAARGLEERYQWAADLKVTERVDALIQRLDAQIREQTLDRALGTIPTFLVTGVLTLFLLGYGRRYFLGFLKQFDDLDRRQFVRRVATRAARQGRAYILFTLVHATANGVVFGLVCWHLGIPAPLSLGAAVALLTVFPLIGPLIGGAPALLLAYGSLNWRVGTAALAVLVLLEVLEVWRVRPFVDRQSVRVGPTVLIIVALLAFELYGFGGAAVSVALAVIGIAALDAISWAREEA